MDGVGRARDGEAGAPSIEDDEPSACLPSEGDELAEQDPEEVSQWRNQVQASWGAQTQHVHHQDPYYDDGDRWAMDVAPERLYERNGAL